MSGRDLVVTAVSIKPTVWSPESNPTLRRLSLALGAIARVVVDAGSCLSWPLLADSYNFQFRVVTQCCGDYFGHLSK